MKYLDGKVEIFLYYTSSCVYHAFYTSDSRDERGSHELIQKSAMHTDPRGCTLKQPVKKHSRKSLRVLGSVGEPINPAAWKYVPPPSAVDGQST